MVKFCSCAPMLLILTFKFCVPGLISFFVLDNNLGIDRKLNAGTFWVNFVLFSLYITYLVRFYFYLNKSFTMYKRVYDVIQVFEMFKTSRKT